MVGGARLESDSGGAHRVILKHKPVNVGVVGIFEATLHDFYTVRVFARRRISQSSLVRVHSTDHRTKATHSPTRAPRPPKLVRLRLIARARLCQFDYRIPQDGLPMRVADPGNRESQPRTDSADAQAVKVHNCSARRASWRPGAAVSALLSARANRVMNHPVFEL